MTPSDGPPPSCTTCKEAAFNRCSGCNDARYCSKKCQKADWPVHKLLCSKLADFPSDKRPSPDHFRAIKFDPEQDAPDFFWHYAPMHGDHYTSNLCDMFAPNFPDTSSRVYNQRQDKLSWDPLWVTCAFGDFKSNRSTHPILRTKSGPVRNWRGLIVAYKDDSSKSDEWYEKCEGKCPKVKCVDLNMADFRNIADLLLEYDRKDDPVIPPSVPTPHEAIVQGVRLNCHTYEPQLHFPSFDSLPSEGRFATVKKPLYHSIFHKHNGSEIAELVGIPLLIQQLPQDFRWSPSKRTWKNPKAQALHISCDPARTNEDPAQDSWGNAPAKWVGSGGDILVMRKDRKPLLEEHLKALAKYCQIVVLPAMSDSKDTVAARKEVLNGINQKAFAVFWVSYKRHKEFTVRSPYE